MTCLGLLIRLLLRAFGVIAHESERPVGPPASVTHSRSEQTGIEPRYSPACRCGNHRGYCPEHETHKRLGGPGGVPLTPSAGASRRRGTADRPPGEQGGDRHPPRADHVGWPEAPRRAPDLGRVRSAMAKGGR